MGSNTQMGMMKNEKSILNLICTRFDFHFRQIYNNLIYTLRERKGYAVKERDVSLRVGGLNLILCHIYIHT